MRHRRRRSFVVILAALATWSCSSPTEPSPKYTLRAIGALATAGGSPTLLGYTASIDGQNIYPPTTFMAAVSRDEFLVDTEGARGHHTLTIRIDRQTQIQAEYSATDVRVILADSFFPSLHEIGRVSLPAQSASLGASQSFVFAFDI